MDLAAERGSFQAAGSASSTSSAASAASAASIWASSFFARATSFLERAGGLRRRGGGGRPPAWSASPSARPPRAPRARARTRASRRRRSAASGPRPRRCACRRRRAARGRARSAAARPGTAAARPPAPRGSPGPDGWSARRGSGRSRPSARGSPATAAGARRRDSPSSGFSASSPLNRNWPSSDRAWLGVSFVARWQASSTLPVAPFRSSACWPSSPSLTLWPRRSLPPSNSRPPVSAVISVVLPEPLAPTSDTCSARSSHSSASRSSTRVADLQLAVLELEHDAARALRRLEREPERLAVLRVARQPLDLVELLRARLRLPGARAGAEAVDEALELGDLGLLLLDRAPERQLALRLLGPPRVPGALEELRAPGLELQHRRADGLQEPAVVRDQHDRGVERLQVRLEPLQRLDVEVVGRLVEQQQVRVAGQRARQATRA